MDEALVSHINMQFDETYTLGILPLLQTRLGKISLHDGCKSIVESLTKWIYITDTRMPDLHLVTRFERTRNCP